MSGRLKIAAQLIRDREFDIAMQMLEKEILDPKALYLSSLLYRYNDEYDKEKTVIDRALVLDSDNAYMRERLFWHSLPLFDRLVPRQPLRLPRDPNKIPTQETLENLCIVTSATSNGVYFELASELIESIKATQTYKNVDICVLDCGLTDTDKNQLISKFPNLCIKDPGWDIPLEQIQPDERNTSSPELLNGMKGFTARPFIQKHFPGYRYYFWCDADTWIQDENALDNYLFHAMVYGCGVTKDHAGGNWDGCWWQRMNQSKKIYPNYYDVELTGKPFLTSAIFCIDDEHPLSFFDEWIKAFQVRTAQYGCSWGTEEIDFCYIINKITKERSIPTLDRTYNSSCICHGFPVVVPDDSTLRDPLTLNILGIIHFIASPMTKKYPFFPMAIVNRPLTEEEGQQNRQIFCQVSQHYCEGRLPQQLQYPENMKLLSYHFRTWPWADKPEIQDLIRKEVQVCLDT